VRIIRLLPPLCQLLVLLLWLGNACAAVPEIAAPSELLQKHVLVLVSVGPGRPGVDRYLSSLHESLVKGGLDRLHVHIEYLDFVNNPDPELRRLVRETLLRKYAGIPIDLVIGFQATALNFLLDDARGVAPGKPVMMVFTPVPRALAESDRQLTLQTPTSDYRGIMTRALELFPKTRRVIVLTDEAAARLFDLAGLREQLAPWKDRLEIEDTSRLSFDEALRRVAASPEHSIIIALGYVGDTAGKAMTTLDSTAMAARVANAPVFVIFDNAVGRGAIGGMVSGVHEDAESMAAAALDKLRGITKQSEPVALLPTTTFSYFDWQVVERFGGDPGQLPATTKFINRPLTLWGQYRGYVIAGALVILLLTGLIIALLLQRHRRVAAELSLRESEQRLRTLIERAPLGIAFSRDGITLDANQAYLQMFGYERSAELSGTPLIEQIAPQCREDILEQLRRRVEDGVTQATYESVGLRKDGSQFPFIVSTSRLVFSDGATTIAFFLDL
jgi:PAS domain S-box-containing protein